MSKGFPMFTLRQQESIQKKYFQRNNIIELLVQTTIKHNCLTFEEEKKLVIEA